MAFITETGKAYEITGANIGVWKKYDPPSELNSNARD